MGSFPGIGVMINQLADRGRGYELVTAAKDKDISSISLDKTENYDSGAVVVKFSDGTSILLLDNGRSCCEYRYITADEEDFSYYAGSQLLAVEEREAPSIKGEYGDEHEVSFLDVKTTKGTITFSTHNEHNGYYGGFYLCVVEGKKDA